MITPRPWWRRACHRRRAAARLTGKRHYLVGAGGIRTDAQNGVFVRHFAASEIIEHTVERIRMLAQRLCPVFGDQLRVTCVLS